MQLLGFEHLGATPEGLPLGMIAVSLMDPRSRGAVRLASEDPRDDPVVEFDMLSDDSDMTRMMAGVRYLAEIVQHPAVSSIGQVVGLDDEGTSFEALADDDALRSWLARSVGDYVHACGTCRMGRPDDPMA